MRPDDLLGDDIDFEQFVGAGAIAPREQVKTGGIQELLAVRRDVGYFVLQLNRMRAVAVNGQLLDECLRQTYGQITPVVFEDELVPLMHPAPETRPPEHQFGMFDVETVDRNLAFLARVVDEIGDSRLDPIGARVPQRLITFAQDQNIGDDLGSGVGAKGAARQSGGCQQLGVSGEMPPHFGRLLIERIPGSDKGDDAAGSGQAQSLDEVVIVDGGFERALPNARVCDGE